MNNVARSCTRARSANTIAICCFRIGAARTEILRQLRVVVIDGPVDGVVPSASTARGSSRGG